MKKMILLIVVVVTTAVITKGQDLSPVQLGIKAGANLTNITGESFNNGYRLNYLFGAYLTLNFNDNIGLQPELEFSQVSTTTSTHFSDIYGDLGPSVTQNPHLNYMSIPILLNIGGKFLKFQVGPQYSILMNNSESFWGNGRQAFTTGDVGLDGGIWLNLPLHLNAFARYIVGLKDINDIDNQDTWRSQQIQLGLGLRL